MHRYLLASTAVLALAAPAAAETISTAVTQPVRTSTVKNGSPDSITIATAGSVKPASGTAVTMDSNHTVTNQGTIAISNANGAIGILTTAGTTGDIENSGGIAIDEPYTPTDANNDGDLDGPFALGSNRFGIRTAGAHSGKVTNNGTIKIEGNDSAGIWLGGPLTGAFTHNGSTVVIGDRSVGVHAEAITGNVRLAGTVGVQGEGAIGAHFAGDVTGAMVVQGNISASGYRYTTAPASTANLDADDLLQGGPALRIEGNVSGGIVLAVAPKDNDKNDTDEDDDGIEDAKEGSAIVASYGAAPAMVIGATNRDIVIGSVAGTATQFGLIVDGTIIGNGVYAGVNGTGLQIGGRGGAVSIANGMSIAGTVSARSNGANATALQFGNGASVPEVRVSGTVDAVGGNTASAQATAIQIDQGASVPVIRNSGSIKATAGGTTGSATAILDRSGGLTLVENSGAILATGAATDSTRNIAIDLSANTSGATIKQTQVATGIAAPSIAGDIRFGSGNDTFDVADGTVKGTTYFGAGTNALKLSGDAVQTGKVIFGAGVDAMSVSGTSQFDGTVDFGGGADTLTLSGKGAFIGSLINAGNLAVNVTGGTLNVTKPSSIGSLAVGAEGVLVATLDKSIGNGALYTVAGTTSFAKGASLAVKIADVDNAEGHYLVLQSGSITGLSDVKFNTDLVPFLFKATLATNSGPNAIAVDIVKRSAQELGLNQSQSAAYNAVFAALNNDDKIEDVFLGITTGEQFRATLGQMLPDHAGGAFEGISLGSRTLGRQVAQPTSPVYSLGGLDIILNTAGWSSSKDIGVTAAYDVGGMGFSAAGEIDTGVGSFGASAAWFWNVHDDGDLREVESRNWELAGYWRGNWGGFAAFSRASIGLANFNSTRTFSGTANGEAVTKTSKGEWDGTVFTLSGGASYEGHAGKFFFRPSVTADYVKLAEDGYTETGGGKGLDLIVNDRDSDQLAVNGGLAVGLDFVGRGGGGLWRAPSRDNRWFRVEAEGGWREIAGGTLGATTAHFDGGTAFTLEPEQYDSGWFTRARIMGGTDRFEMDGEVGVEDRNGNTALSLLGTLRIGF
ncbi:autotransporter outer membrane beta-barrel domain-containing protein [Altererythrobacter sp. Root672]|uniref:autotransporter outer membrane beta-barrel domain-containing protein n=1 Tax=Altererythrobacter sp. Root672 TaxID=1736584 RepID=UPI0006F3AE38|nr:autotransporter outer membrane beta-barrel domain-containing protein [Altererythrobacter sp. Root672]KRA82670.1 transporter [Altererythrobacter sp. Root672]